MRIKRKYEWFGLLYENDLLAREAIDSAFAEIGFPEDRKKYLIEQDYSILPVNMDMGSGIPGQCYRSFMDCFEELDKTDPYDNGLTFKDVSSADIETSRKGTAIQFRLIKRWYDMPERIVGFVAVENVNNQLAINKGWD